MIVNPIPSPANIAPSTTEPQRSRVEAMRSIKIRTNANPVYYDPSNPMDAEQPKADSVNQPLDEAAEATQPISPQFAALAKQRRALQVKERELAEREKALSSSPAGDSIALARLKSEPLKVLLEAGVSYDQLTEDILNNQGSQEINALKAEINALKEGLDQKFSERDQMTEKQVLAEMRKDADRLAGEGDDFELVRGTGSIPAVMKLIERTWREQGEVLDVREAMEAVEAELLSDIQKMTSLKKVQSQFIPQAQQQMQRQPQGMRTLTNRDTASVPMSAKARALAAFYGNLKK